ncbi:disease resistance protein RPS2-like [Bidens hawaiensis]|uniref:disease resistance protein RPS2-like n=1 Tax=Bidens hawaiensis TaxID=980011 RepID=UPI004049B71E
MDWIAEKLVEGALGSTKASMCMDTNHSNLKAKLETMCAVRDDLKDQSTKYKSTRKRTMDIWFENVKNVEKDAHELESCFLAIKDTSALTHLFPRKKLSGKMASMCLDIDKLINESKQLWNSLVHKAAERVLKMTAPDISNVTSQKDALNQILQRLQDEDCKAIRVVGMSGAGKTTILKNLNNHERVVDMFERVIWVTVSGEENHKENLSIAMLQCAIAERLIIDMEGTTDIAGKIKEELEGVKYLLLLDDVKADPDLDKIGIPGGARGSKIVMTTKFLHVKLPSCYSIEVKKVSPFDSWNMLDKLLAVNNDVKEKPQLERIARKAIEICDGLPLMIKMAASVFNTTEPNEIGWSDGLQTFKRWPEKRENNIMKNLLKFCCDHLNHEQKGCFLYSALHPGDTEICMEGLLECWAAEKFLKGDDAKKDGRDIVRHLKNVILLEEGTTWQFVRMHKVIRALALTILSEDMKDGCLVRTSEALQRPNVPKRHRVDLWTDKKWISLANNSINTLPEAPHSSQLTTLFVQKYSKLKYIPDSFFQHMHSLLVLILYKTEITTLPPSTGQLSNLKVLYLNGCNVLKELPSLIGELESLEVLDIRGSGVCKLPHQIKSLPGLRRLLVSFTVSTQANYDVIIELSGLEELIIDVSSEVQKRSELIEDLVEKFSALPSVITFQLYVVNEVIDVIQVVGDTVKVYMPTEHHLLNFLGRRQDFEVETQCFQVFIGCFISHGIEIPDFNGYDKYLKYYNGKGCHDVINKVLNNVQAFELINHNDIENLSINVVESMEYVKCCLIKSCSNMKAIVVCDRTVSRPLLYNMERLDAKNLPKLKSIWKGDVPPGSLSNLRTLVLCECPMLTMVFYSDIFNQLRELQHLEVQDCCRVEEIVMCSQDVRSSDIPKLTTLILCQMPGLRKICSALDWTSLRTLKIHDCPALKDFPFNNITALTAPKIEIEKKWWEALRWPDSEVKQQLESYCLFR